MNYDEALKAFHELHPEYDTANVGTYILHDKVINALKEAAAFRKAVEDKRAYHIAERDKHEEDTFDWNVHNDYVMELTDLLGGAK